MIDLCLLGTGGMMPLPKRFLTSLILRHDGSSVLIDCGESTQVALHLSGFSPAHIDHLLITHFHGDHVSGLPGLLLTIANHNRRSPLHIWGGEGLKKVVRGLTVICDRLPYALSLHELSFKEAGSFTTGALRWTTCPVKHRIPCLAYRADLPRQGKFDSDKAKALEIPIHYWSRLQKGETISSGDKTWRPEDVLGPARKGLRIAYATDCRPSPALVELARGSDLLIAEGLYDDDGKKAAAADKGHMVFSEAARLAKAAEVTELWLTHFSPALLRPKEGLADARKIFPNTYCGSDLKRRSLRFSDE